MLVEESKGALNPKFALRSQEYASKVDLSFSVPPVVWDRTTTEHCSVGVGVMSQAAQNIHEAASTPP